MIAVIQKHNSGGLVIMARVEGEGGKVGDVVQLLHREDSPEIYDALEKVVGELIDLDFETGKFTVVTEE